MDKKIKFNKISKLDISLLLVYLDLLIKVRYVNGSSLITLIIYSAIVFLNIKTIAFPRTKLFYIFITILFAICSFIIYYVQKGKSDELYNVEEYVYFTPLLYFVSKIKEGTFLKSILSFTYNNSIILLSLSILIFFSRGYSFSLLPNIESRFNFDVKGNLFGPIIMLAFFPISLFYNFIRENSKLRFNIQTISLWLGVVFIIYYGYYTLTRSLIFVLFYFVSFYLIYSKWYYKLLLIPLVAISSFFLLNLSKEYRDEDDFSSGRTDELSDFKNYLKDHEAYYVIPSLYGFTTKSNSSDFVGSNKMMHNGFYHLVLQFGYILALLVYLTLFYFLIKSFLIKYKFESIVLLNFLFVSFIGTQWFSAVDMILLYTILSTISRVNYFQMKSKVVSFRHSI